MKKFKMASDVMLIIALGLLGIGIIISVISATPEEAIFLALVQTNALILTCACVGVFLIFAKSDTARKLGNGLTVVGFVTAVICALTTLTVLSEQNQVQPQAQEVVQESSTSLGAVITIIAVAVLVAHYAFLLVSYMLSRNSDNIENPNEDIRVIRIKEWKQLLEEGIISREEFEAKRIQILGLKSKNEK